MPPAIPFPARAQCPPRFSPRDRAALIAAAMAMPGDVVADFDTDEAGHAVCWFMPGRVGDALCSVAGDGSGWCLEDPHGVTLANSPDMTTIVRAAHRLTGCRVG